MRIDASLTTAGRIGQPELPGLPRNRTCCGHAKTRMTQSGHQPQRQHRALVSRPPVQFSGRTGGPCSSLIVPSIATLCRTLLTRKCGTGKTGRRFLLSPIAYHRHYWRAVWIDPVVLRAITISWNNIGIPVRSLPYYGLPDDKQPRRWFTNDFGLPRMGCGTKRPQVTQHQGRSESDRGHYPHTSASLLQNQFNEHLVMIVPAARG
jgi:hypothetical protein